MAYFYRPYCPYPIEPRHTSQPYPISGFPAPRIVIKDAAKFVARVFESSDPDAGVRDIRDGGLIEVLDESAYVSPQLLWDVILPIMLNISRRPFSFENSYGTDLVLHPKQVAFNFRKRMRLAQFNKWMPVDAWLQLLYTWCAPTLVWPYM